MSNYSAVDAAMKGFEFGINAAHKMFWNEDMNPPSSGKFLIYLDDEVFIGKRSADNKVGIFKNDTVILTPISNSTSYLWANIPVPVTKDISFKYGLGVDNELKILVDSLTSCGNVLILCAICSSNDNMLEIQLKVDDSKLFKRILSAFGNVNNRCYMMFDTTVTLDSFEDDRYIVKILSKSPYNDMEQLSHDVQIIIGRINSSERQMNN